MFFSSSPCSLVTLSIWDSGEDTVNCMALFSSETLSKNCFAVPFFLRESSHKPTWGEEEGGEKGDNQPGSLLSLCPPSVETIW